MHAGDDYRRGYERAQRDAQMRGTRMGSGDEDVAEHSRHSNDDTGGSPNAHVRTGMHSGYLDDQQSGGGSGQMRNSTSPSTRGGAYDSRLSPKSNSDRASAGGAGSHSGLPNFPYDHGHQKAQQQSESSDGEQDRGARAPINNTLGQDGQMKKGSPVSSDGRSLSLSPSEHRSVEVGDRMLAGYKSSALGAHAETESDQEQLNRSDTIHRSHQRKDRVLTPEKKTQTQTQAQAQERIASATPQNSEY